MFMFSFVEKKYFSLLLILACFLSITGRAQPNTWVVAYGGYNYDRGKGICQTYDKGFVICGSTASFGQGNTDFYLLKVDANGKFKWQKSFGDINLENCFSVKQTNDSGFVICGYSNSFGTGGYDVYMVKTDSLGNLQWEKNYGGNDWDFAYWAEQTQDGGYIIAGESFSNSSHQQAYLIKTNSAGDTVWTKKYGGANNASLKEVHQTKDNGYVAAGYIQVSAGNKDFFVVKTDAAGDTLWTKKYGSASNDSCNSIAVCKDKGFLLAGNRDTLKKHKALFYKLDSAGNITKTVFENTASGNRSIARIIESVEGDYVLIANTDVGGFGGQEIRMDKYNTGGWWVWGRSFGGTSDDEGYDLIQTTYDSGYAVVGYTASYGSGPDNVFIGKTNSLGLHTNTVDSYVSVKEKTNQKDILIYPNPVKDNLTIAANNHFINGVIIYNVMGEIVYDQQQVNSHNHSIHLEDYPTGLYMIELRTGKESVRRKIIIEK